MTIIVIFVIVALLFLICLINPFGIYDEIAVVFEELWRELRRWFKEKVAREPFRLEKPTEMVILNKRYFEDVAGVASLWVVIPYNKGDYATPARSVFNFFRVEEGYVLNCFRVIWPMVPPPSELDAWMYQPVASVFIDDATWMLIKNGDWDGYLVRCGEERMVRARRYGKVYAMVVTELVKPISQVEISRLRSVDDFVAK